MWKTETKGMKLFRISESYVSDNVTAGQTCCGQLWVWHTVCGQTCDGLYHFVIYLVILGLYSEIDHTYLSIEAQCVSHHYPRWTATRHIDNMLILFLSGCKQPLWDNYRPHIMWKTKTKGMKLFKISQSYMSDNVTEGQTHRQYADLIPVRL